MRHGLLRHFVIASILISLSYTFFWHHRSTGSLLQKRRKELERKNAQVVLVGNSILRAGILPQELERLLHRPLTVAFSNGSASAWWYLYIKNVVCQVSPSPNVAIILFRDHFLTDPAFRTAGKYRCPLRTLSTDHEPLLTKLLAGKGVAHLWDSPWTWLPEETKEKLDRKLGTLAGKMAGLNRQQEREALSQAFDPERMVPEWITNQQIAAESIQDESLFQFADQLADSFLPAIIDELKKRNIQPVFVRMKRRVLLHEKEPEPLRQYIAQLKSYLENEGAILLDFSGEPRIVETHFGPGDHLNQTGRTVFTRLLAERLASEVAFFDKSPENAPSLHKAGAA